MKHGVDVRLSIFHVHLDYYTIPFPDLHTPTPSFSCVSWARCPEPKSCYLIQLKMLLSTLPPFLQIQYRYFTLLVGILGRLLKLQGRGGYLGSPSHHTAEFSCRSSDCCGTIVFTEKNAEEKATWLPVWSNTNKCPYELPMMFQFWGETGKLRKNKWMLNLVKNKRKPKLI